MIVQLHSPINQFAALVIIMCPDGTVLARASSAATTSTGATRTRTARTGTSAQGAAPTGSVSTSTSVQTPGNDEDIMQCGDLQCCRYSADTLAYCGNHTTCQNSHGSFSCPCVGGYQVILNMGTRIGTNHEVLINLLFPSLSWLTWAAVTSTNVQRQGGMRRSGTTAGV